VWKLSENMRRQAGVQGVEIWAGPKKEGKKGKRKEGKEGPVQL